MGNSPRSTLPILRYLLATLLAVGAATGLAQSDEEKTRRQLQQLEKDIKRINWEIARETTRRSALQRQLRDAEVEMGQLKKDIAATRQAIAQGETELEQLGVRQGQLVQARDAQQERIRVELRSAWRAGSQGQLKVLLNQNDPHTLARALTYYRYIFEARNTLLQDYRETLQELAEVAQRVDANIAESSRTRDSLEQQRKELTDAVAEREFALAELSTSIDSKEKALKNLQADRAELEKLLQAIEEAVVDLEVPDDYQAFDSAKGTMPWPLAGKRSNRFGRLRNAGKMRWQGVNIPAREGTKVTAIHHGRVVYADWLRGSGLLLIIDHGDGYMSLYAHNSSLLRDVGEWVSAGTEIATVGRSGGQDRSSLYFEIRQDGKPVDPAKWCRD